MAPTLGYWEIRGYASPIKMMLAQAGQEWEWKGLETDAAHREVWVKEIKFTLGLDYPNLPYYIDGEVKLSQSMAIMRYLARKFGLEGKTEQEKQRIDQAVYQAIDLRTALVKLFYSDWNDEAKAKFLNPEERNSLPYHLKLFNAVLEKRNFVGGDSVSFGDFVLWETVEWIEYAFPKSVDGFKAVKDFQERIKALPNIKKFMDSERWMEWPLVSSMADFGFKEEDRLGRYPK